MTNKKNKLTPMLERLRNTLGVRQREIFDMIINKEKIDKTKISNDVINLLKQEIKKAKSLDKK